MGLYIELWKLINFKLDKDYSYTLDFNKTKYI